MSRIVVFAGPTISSEQVHTIVPQAEVHPPVASGDLIRASLVAGDVVAIIDGFYFQSSAVRHKEILDILNNGVHVWGAASMGALRAAELAPFGMRGFGSIFNAYAQGEIEGDDEVAVLHAPEEMGYTNLTEALVNIRYTCASALSAGILTTDETSLIIDVACTLPFHDRTYPRIVEKARTQGLSEEKAKALQGFVQQRRLDLKHNDALALIQALCTPPQEPAQTSFAIQETTFLRNWKIFSKGTFLNEEMYVSDADIFTACQLFSADYPQLHYHILLELLASIAHHASETIAAKEQSKSAALAAHVGLAEMQVEQEHTHLPEEALTQLAARYIAQQCQLNLNEKEQLPASLHRWLLPEEQQLPRLQQLARIGIRLWQEPRSYSWHQAVIDHLKKSQAFYSLLKIVLQSRTFNEALREQHQELELEYLSSLQIYEWFIKRWGITPSTARIALLDRGFQGLNDFLERARPFYLLDRYIGVAELHMLPSQDI